MEDEVYFALLAIALREAGCHGPRLVIDLDRLDANTDAIAKGAVAGVGLRIVDKSLPSIDLMRRIMSRVGTKKVMSFHLPVTLAMLDAIPDIEVLYGKPLPVAALAKAITELEPESRERLVRQTVFLMDTQARLHEFAALAESHAMSLRIAFEVDVGMHRGGISDPVEVAALCAVAAAHPHIVVEGLMAYEAHIPEMPAMFGGADREQAQVIARVAALAAVLPENARKIINTGGSKTVLAYPQVGAANELSVGSAFVKPTDFDKPSLGKLQPAAFIATPILKVADALLPGPQWITGLMQVLRLFGRKGCFIYGGNWLAKPVHPPGMAESKLWGRSSNQQFMSLPDDSRAKVDDMAFFRPTQSEAVLQHFGPLLIYSQGRIVGEWAPLPPG